MFGHCLAGIKRKRTEDPRATRLVQMGSVFRARVRVLYRGMVGLLCSSSKVLNKLTPAMLCGMYGALPDAG
jgi:hypothetical protein